jgi:hypothetical protein
MSRNNFAYNNFADGRYLFGIFQDSPDADQKNAWGPGDFQVPVSDGFAFDVDACVFKGFQ